MKCKKCEKEIKEEMAFCPYCGTEVAPNQKIYCPSCKTEIEPDMLFCPCCGYEISKNEHPKFVQSSSEDVGLQQDKKYCKDGIVANVKDQSFFTPKTTVNSNAQTENTGAQNLGKREKLKTATVLSAVGAVLSVVVAVCILLLPLFTTTYSETINGETVYTEKNMSMLVFVIESVKSISSVSDISSYKYLSWLYLFLQFSITILVVTLIVSSIKLSVKKLKNLIKFEEYSKNELSKDASGRSADDFVKAFKGVAKGNQLFQVIIDLGLIIFLFGYGTVVWSTIITIVVMASIAYIIEKIAAWIKKKALA